MSIIERVYRSEDVREEIKSAEAAGFSSSQWWKAPRWVIRDGCVMFTVCFLTEHFLGWKTQTHTCSIVRSGGMGSEWSTKITKAGDKETHRVLVTSAAPVSIKGPSPGEQVRGDRLDIPEAAASLEKQKPAE